MSMIRVTFQGEGQRETTRGGMLVSCVQVFAPAAPGPIGQREPSEPRPNIWGVIADDVTGVLVALPIYKITAEVKS